METAFFAQSSMNPGPGLCKWVFRRVEAKKPAPSSANMRQTSDQSAPLGRFRNGSGQIKQQHFALAGLARDLNPWLLRDGRSISGFELLPIERDRTPDHLQPGVTSLFQFALYRLTRRKRARENLRVLVELDHAAPVAALGRRHQPQPAPLLFGWNRILLVRRTDSFLFRQNPDLVEVHRRGSRWVELAVPNAASGAHLLHLSGTDHRAGPHAVFVF